MDKEGYSLPPLNYCASPGLKMSPKGQPQCSSVFSQLGMGSALLLEVRTITLHSKVAVLALRQSKKICKGVRIGSLVSARSCFVFSQASTKGWQTQPPHHVCASKNTADLALLSPAPGTSASLSCNVDWEGFKMDQTQSPEYPTPPELTLGAHQERLKSSP